MFNNPQKNQDAKKIIIALDFESIEQARLLVAKLDPNLCRVKVGKEMFTLYGPQWVSELVELGFEVFLDLKFHDIPNTVAKACVAAAKLGVWMVNVHASGGAKMMATAKRALDNFDGPRPLLIAVTVLTSMDQQEFSQIGYSRTIEEQVLHLAKLANSSGLDGVVCSAWEAERLTKEIGGGFKLITPGIRPEGADKGDQSRIMTPAQAIIAGSSYLVVGRPITQASDPLTSLCEISESLVVL